MVSERSTKEKTEDESEDERTSEDDRKSRLLQATITHPNLDLSNQDLTMHVKQFLQNRLNMPPREVDANLHVQKTPRPNSVLLKFSDRKFKNFLYSARKRMRNSESNLNDLYINEHLTSYNYSILKYLKTEKRRRSEGNLPNFHSVYSFEGKIYIKMHLDEQSNQAVHVKNHSSIQEFVSKLDGDSPI